MGRACPVGIIRSQGRLDHIRRRPILARDAHRCWTEAMRTSENLVKRNSKFGLRFFSEEHRRGLAHSEGR